MQFSCRTPLSYSVGLYLRTARSRVIWGQLARQAMSDAQWAKQRKVGEWRSASGKVTSMRHMISPAHLFVTSPIPESTSAAELNGASEHDRLLNSV